MEEHIVKTYVFSHSDDFELILELDSEGRYQATFRVPSTDYRLKQGLYGMGRTIEMLKENNGSKWTLIEPPDLDTQAELSGIFLDLSLSGQCSQYKGDTGLEDD